MGRVETAAVLVRALVVRTWSVHGSVAFNGDNALARRHWLGDRLEGAVCADWQRHSLGLKTM